jgi:hypothetical protein
VATAQRLQDLVRRLSDDSASLVRSEIELVKLEMRDKAMTLGKAAALGAGAAMVVLLALFAFVQAAIYGLGEALPLWASGLIVGAALVVIAAILGLLARRSAIRSGGPMPTRAVEEAQAVVEELKGVRP